MEEYICRFCGKKCKNPNSLRNHERLCKLNPDYDAEKYAYMHGSTGNIGLYNQRIREGKVKHWAKGQTKETNLGIAERGRLASIRQKGKPGNTKGMKYNNSKGLSGGLRHGAGRGKKGRYNGIWCDSSWELAFVIYNLEHNIIIKRNKDYFEYTYNNETHKYFPDFIINDEYIEIKGFDTDKVNAKIEQFPKDKILKVYHKEDLTEVFDYVINKYGNDFIKLYE